MIQPGYYALDRIENGLALLQKLAPPQGEAVWVTVPAAKLPGKSRPADGTVFVWDETDGWRPAPHRTRQRRKCLQAKLAALLQNDRPEPSGPAAPAEQA